MQWNKGRTEENQENIRVITQQQTRATTITHDYRKLTQKETAMIMKKQKSHTIATYKTTQADQQKHEVEKNRPKQYKKTYQCTPTTNEKQ